MCKQSLKKKFVAFYRTFVGKCCVNKILVHENF